MATEIRGTADAQTKMILGQVRRVFEPEWIQSFENGGATIQFTEQLDAVDELVNFMEMYGYTFAGEKDRVWWHYDFK